MEISCDNPAIEEKLAQLVAVLKRNGARFHPDLVLSCQSGDFFALAARPIKNGDEVAYVPFECFIDLHQFLLGYEEQLITIISVAYEASPLSRELIKLILDLYNLTYKLERFQESSVYSFYYEASDLYNELTKGFHLRAHEYLKGSSKEQALLRSFIDHRSLNGKASNGEEAQFLVPFIEYFNHHKNAVPAQFFNQKSEEQEHGMKVSAYVESGKQELFIKYGSSDARELFIYQGFIDPSISRAKSIYVEFKVKDKNIVVFQNSLIPTARELPAHLKDLYGYCPHFDFSEPDTVKFGFLYIPSKSAPRFLARILLHGMSRLTHDGEEAKQLAKIAEEKIVSENLKYYQGLKNQLDNFSTSTQTAGFIQNAKEMTELQLSIVENYARTVQKAAP